MPWWFVEYWQYLLDRMVGRVCPAELQLNTVGSSDTEAPVLGLGLCVSDGAVSTGICGGRDDFDFGVVDFPFLDGGVPRRASCSVCVSRNVAFAGASSGLGDFGCRSRALAAKLHGRGCRCFGLRGATLRVRRLSGGMWRRSGGASAAGCVGAGVLR